MDKIREKMGAFVVWLRDRAIAFGGKARAVSAAICAGVGNLLAWLHKRAPRMSLPNILALLLVSAVVCISPKDGPVLVYKLGAVSAGGCLAYLLDVAAFPYAKPSGYLRYDWRAVETFEDDKPDYGIVPGYELAFYIACARRMALVCAGMLAVALAL